jgi:hypothetical protein
MQIFLIVGLVISVVLMLTTEPVSKLLAPQAGANGGPGSYIRTMLSVFWMLFGRLFAIILALLFGLGLAFLN